jgi:tRNA(Leu) C34 or U34 (ribose-2'-O)-methylase TrmL
MFLFRAKFLFFSLLNPFGFRVEKSLMSKYLQRLALKEKSIISIIVATKFAQFLQNEKSKVFLFFKRCNEFVKQ